MPDEVFTITSAPVSMADDQRHRQRNYILSMGVRTACFLGAIVTPSPWRWVLVAGAVILPYVAVIFANAGRAPAAPAMTITVERSAIPSRTDD